MRALAPDTWNRLLAFVPASWRPALPGDKLHKIATLLENSAPDAIYRRLVSQWEQPDEIAAAGREPHGPLWDETVAQDFPDFVPRMQFLDMVTYLPDDILTKVDRATMAVGLEGRVPLLDHRVVAYSWSLPPGFKVRGGQQQMAAAPRARSLCAEAADRPAEDGLRRADRCLAARSACGTGRKRCWRRRGLHPTGWCGSSRCAGRGGSTRGDPQLAISVVDRADAAGVAREVGVTPRPRKIVYVTAGLGGGGAEAMLTRLVTARPSIADEITVVSLLRAASAHVERLRAAGVTVVELDFDTAWRASRRGCRKLARLIAATRPDIVQGWMYHGDLAALIALAMSGRRRQTRLVWSIRCSEMDLRRYGVGLRAVVKACTLLSRRPDLVTANSTAGLESHLSLGYRPRRAEVTINGIDVDEFRPDAAARARRARSSSAFPTMPIVLAHVARVDPMKDHGSFLAAMAELPELHALLIGTGTENLPAARNILRLGRRRDVPRLSAAADFVVSSSSFGEGFSNALAEGMACGLPAVATDVGDARLIVGDSGLVVPPGNPAALAAAIRTLAREPATARAERAAKARARIVENFAMSRAVARYAELYASLA